MSKSLRAVSGNGRDHDHGHHHRRQNLENRDITICTVWTLAAIAAVCVIHSYWSLPHNSISDSPTQLDVPNRNTKQSEHDFPKRPVLEEHNDDDELTDNQKYLKGFRRLLDYEERQRMYLNETHKLADQADKVRMTFMQFIQRDMPVPKKTMSIEDSGFTPSSFIWGNRSLMKEYRKRICEKQNKAYLPRLKSIEILPARTRANITTLVQYSWKMLTKGYDDEIASTEVWENTKAQEKPFCDLRLCNQDLFPFIYIVVPHRNRVTNLERLISSIRNATMQCDQPPPWYHCLCIYVNDYGSDPKLDLFDRLSQIWMDKVRILQRENVTDPWIKAKTYNSALRHIPTPSRRSFVFHIDADLIVTETTFIDKGMRTTTLGLKAAFPMIYGTKGSVETTDDFYKHAITGDMAKSPHAWLRVGGQGMTFFYLYDNPVGFIGPHTKKTTWGGEDNWFWTQFAQTKRPSRYRDDSLWHIHHASKHDWTKSKSGLG